MELLKKKILNEGEIYEGNILKVDCFLNHQIDVPFLKGEEKVDYGYEEEFSPRLLIQDIIMKWNTNERKPQEARKDRGL